MSIAQQVCRAYGLSQGVRLQCPYRKGTPEYQQWMHELRRLRNLESGYGRNS